MSSSIVSTDEGGPDPEAGDPAGPGVVGGGSGFRFSGISLRGSGGVLCNVLPLGTSLGNAGAVGAGVSKVKRSASGSGVLGFSGEFWRDLSFGGILKALDTIVSVLLVILRFIYHTERVTLC